MAANQLLEWQNLFFLVFTVLGFVTFILSALSGGHGGHGDHAVGHGGNGFGHCDHGGVGHEHGIGHGAGDHGGHAHEPGNSGDNMVSRMFAMLGVGKAPLSLVMTIYFLLFGVFGLVGNTLFTSLVIVSPKLYFYFSLGLAAILALVVSGWFARGIGRVMPNEEEIPSFHAEDLVGQVGEVILFVDEKSGYVHIYDQFQNLQKINVRTTAGVTIPTGRYALIESYEKEGNFYYVSESPIAPIKK